MLLSPPTLPVLLLSLLLLNIQQTQSAVSVQNVLQHDNSKPAPENVTTLTFDDLPAPPLSAPFSPLTTYTHLTFSSLPYFDAAYAASHNLISATDADCAWSSPHALLGSRSANPRAWPRFTLNATHAATAGLSPYFDLTGIAIKCMNDTPVGTAVWVQALGIDFAGADGHSDGGGGGGGDGDGDVKAKRQPVIKRSYQMSLTTTRAGPVFQYPLDLVDLFPSWGSGVNVVEMYAVTASGEDWPFCVDDIRVRFHGVDEKEVEDVLEQRPQGWIKHENHEKGLLLQARRLV